ncbi:hypothetical protein So717_12440 [Roseobacter cerasinus]|uniref:Uncharacterized protein n=1 Tax=Roseobacter cerasinus TaxID=2602289 RepID=A0A640VQX2_9RHOB|nr:hypothetical protein [Roseobacter cerasinus]GFE49491.1 hypothetical protein So717_12440 [Roseobacter cerasinus]
MTQLERRANAALTILILLQLTMLSALYAGIEPHPPVATPLFGIAPFIGASISIALAAIIVTPLGTITGRVLSVVAALMAMASFGPQKYFDAQIGMIWPAVGLGQMAALVIGASVLLSCRPIGKMGDSGWKTAAKAV